MSEPTQTAPAAAELDTRLSSLERVVQEIKAAVTGAHRDATATTEARLDAPGSVAEEVRRELARAEKEKLANETEAEHKARVEALEEKVVRLTEKTPAPPPRKIERIMGWHG